MSQEWGITNTGRTILKDSASLNRKVGRPTKLTPELQDEIVTYIEAGSYIETAAKAAGISKECLYNWLRQGAAGKKPYKGFSDAVQKALGNSEIRDINVINNAAEKGVWQAAAWKLERRNPKMWGKHEYQEITEADVPTRRCDPKQVVEEYREAIIAALESGEADERLLRSGSPD